MTNETSDTEAVVAKKEVQNLPYEPTLLCTQRPVGEPPNHFCELRQQIWHEVIDSCVDGLIQSSDFFSLEMLCTLIHEFRTNAKHFDSGHANLLNKLFGDYGLSPKSKIKLLRIWSK